MHVNKPTNSSLSLSLFVLWRFSWISSFSDVNNLWPSNFSCTKVLYRLKPSSLEYLRNTSLFLYKIFRPRLIVWKRLMKFRNSKWVFQIRKLRIKFCNRFTVKVRNRQRDNSTHINEQERAYKNFKEKMLLKSCSSFDNGFRFFLFSNPSTTNSINQFANFQRQ